VTYALREAQHAAPGPLPALIAAHLPRNAPCAQPAKRFPGHDPGHGPASIPVTEGYLRGPSTRGGTRPPLARITLGSDPPITALMLHRDIGHLPLTACEMMQVSQSAARQPSRLPDPLKPGRQAGQRRTGQPRSASCGGRWAALRPGWLVQRLLGPPAAGCTFLRTASRYGATLRRLVSALALTRLRCGR
jgi:hypothetical protein